MTTFDATFILACVGLFLLACSFAAVLDLRAEQRRERITQERHDANARTMRYLLTEDDR